MGSSDKLTQPVSLFQRFVPFACRENCGLKHFPRIDHLGAVTSTIESCVRIKQIDLNSCLHGGLRDTPYSFEFVSIHRTTQLEQCFTSKIV